MSEVVIYTTAFCPFCHRAKALLNHKNVEFTEIDVTMNASKRREMTELSGATSVPQIFADGVHVGDCEYIYELEYDGKLDEKLGIAS